MNKAVAATCEVIEATLGENRAYRKVEDQLYVIKQGSSYVMVSVVPWNDDRAVVRCVAQLVKGVKMEADLALKLLSANSELRFGAFAYVEEDHVVLFLHSILGGEDLSPEAIITSVGGVALIADEWDKRIIRRYGGQSMQDLLEENVLMRILTTEGRSIGMDLK